MMRRETDAVACACYDATLDRGTKYNSRNSREKEEAFFTLSRKFSNKGLQEGSLPATIQWPYTLPFYAVKNKRARRV